MFEQIHLFIGLSEEEREVYIVFNEKIRLILASKFPSQLSDVALFVVVNVVSLIYLSFSHLKYP